MGIHTEEKAVEIIKRFRSLVSHAEFIVFPKTKNSIFLPINMDGWPSIRKFLYKISLPYLYSNDAGKTSIIYFIFSFFNLIMIFSTLILAENIAKSTSTSADWIRFGFLVIFSFLSLYGTVSFLRDSRYHIILRIVVLLVFGIVCLALATNLFPHITPNTRGAMSFEKYAQVLFLVFSSLSPVLLFLINTLLTVLLTYIQILKSTETIQTPTTGESIEKLLHVEIIDAQSNNQGWRLLDLSKDEITYLRLWSESNLNSSEKRTIPAIVVAALISLFLSIDGVRNFITSPFTFTAINGPQSWLSNILLIVVMAFVVIFSKTMIANFKNIAIQSLIVETCLIAEYSVGQEKGALIEKSESPLNVLLNMVAHGISKFM